MRDIWLIAKREYLEQVRGKAFKVTTILIPVVFVTIFSISFLPARTPAPISTSPSPPTIPRSPIGSATSSSPTKMPA